MVNINPDNFMVPRITPLHVIENHKSFKKFLPSIIHGHRNEFALMRDGVIVRYYEMHCDALQTADAFYPDGRYSINKVVDDPIFS